MKAKIAVCGVAVVFCRNSRDLGLTRRSKMRGPMTTNHGSRAGCRSRPKRSLDLRGRNRGLVGLEVTS